MSYSLRSLSVFRRLAISAWNCSSVRVMAYPSFKNMLETERRPLPAQFLESATFLLAAVVSIQPIRCRIVPFGNSGVASSANSYCLTQLWS